MARLASLPVVSSLLLIAWLCPSDAFLAQWTPSCTISSAVRSLLHSFNDEHASATEDSLSRRDAGSSIIAVMASAFATTFTNTDAFAESASEGGRLIEFEVANLDGGGSGRFVVKTRPDWAPKGVERFESLTENGFWNGCRVFRVIPGFIAQVQFSCNVSCCSYYNGMFYEFHIFLIFIIGIVAFCFSLESTGHQKSSRIGAQK